MLAIRWPAGRIDALARLCADGAPATVDLQARHVTAPDGSVQAFEVDPLRREALLHGLDDIGLTLKDDALIREWQAADRRRRPWAWPSAGAKAAA
jgi:3-isopropylmalate/(R)-2-methylmalate dehydratase small subunit